MARGLKKEIQRQRKGIIMAETEPNVEQKQGFEELQVMGEQLLTKVKELVHEGNVRRIIIKQEGHTLSSFQRLDWLVHLCSHARRRRRYWRIDRSVFDRGCAYRTPGRNSEEHC